MYGQYSRAVSNQEQELQWRAYGNGDKQKENCGLKTQLGTLNNGANTN